MTPSADVLILAVLLVTQQVLHHREKRDLLDRLGKPAPPPVPKANKIPQKTMEDALRAMERERNEIL